MIPLSYFGFFSWSFSWFATTIWSPIGSYFTQYFWLPISNDWFSLPSHAIQVLYLCCLFNFWSKNKDSKTCKTAKHQEFSTYEDLICLGIIKYLICSSNIKDLIHSYINKVIIHSGTIRTYYQFQTKWSKFTISPSIIGHTLKLSD